MSGLLPLETKFQTESGIKYIVKQQFVQEGITKQIRQVLGSTKKKTVRFTAKGKYAGHKIKSIYSNGAFRPIKEHGTTNNTGTQLQISF